MKRWMAFVAAAAVAAASGQTVPDPLSLPEALALADRESPEIQLARLRALEAAAEARQTSASLGPQLSVSTTGNYQTWSLAGLGLNELGFGSRVGPFGVFDARSRVTQNALDLSLVASAKAARLEAEANEADAAAVAEQTRLAVIQLFLQALQAGSRGRAADRRRVTAEHALQIAGASYDAGLSNRLEMTRIEQQVERETTAGIRARRERDALITLLIRTLGGQSDRPVRLVEVDEPLQKSYDYATLFEEALERRPELRSHQIRERALAAEKKSAERERFPTILAIGEFGVLGQDPANSVSTWLVGGSVTIPLWTSKRIASAIDAAAIRLEESEQQSRQVVNLISEQIARALVDWRSAQEAVESAQRSAASARETLELELMRFEAGLSTSLNVVEAQTLVAEAEEDQIRARYEGSLALAALAHARGDVRLFLDAP